MSNPFDNLTPELFTQFMAGEIEEFSSWPRIGKEGDGTFYRVIITEWTTHQNETHFRASLEFVSGSQEVFDKWASLIIDIHQGNL